MNYLSKNINFLKFFYSFYILFFFFTLYRKKITNILQVFTMERSFVLQSASENNSAEVFPTREIVESLEQEDILQITDPRVNTLTSSENNESQNNESENNEEDNSDGIEELIRVHNKSKIPKSREELRLAIKQEVRKSTNETIRASVDIHLRSSIEDIMESLHISYEESLRILSRPLNEISYVYFNGLLEVKIFQPIPEIRTLGGKIWTPNEILNILKRMEMERLYEGSFHSKSSRVVYIINEIESRRLERLVHRQTNNSILVIDALDIDTNNFYRTTFIQIERKAADDECSTRDTDTSDREIETD